MAVHYYFNYAQLDEDGMCVGVQTTTVDCSGNPNLVEIPVYDIAYICKYYINGNWYEDAEGNIPWQSSLV